MLLASHRRLVLCSFIRVDHCSVPSTNDLGEDPKYVFFCQKLEVFIPNKLYSVQDPNDSMKALDC